MKNHIYRLAILLSALGGTECTSQPDHQMASRSSQLSISPVSGEDVSKHCEIGRPAVDATPQAPVRVTTLQDRASFLKDVLGKAPPPPPAVVSAPPPVPADYIAKQKQYLQQWQAIRATVSDPAEQESRRLALKQAILPIGQD